WLRPERTVTRLQYGASDLRAGESSRAPAAFGVQSAIAMPLGVWKNPRRGTPAGTADSAGTMASSMGNARAAPTPRTKVRRGKAILVIIIESPPKRRSLSFCLASFRLVYEVGRRRRFHSLFDVVLSNQLGRGRARLKDARIEHAVRDDQRRPSDDILHVQLR